MAGRVDDNLMVKLIDHIPSENVTVHQLCCRTSLDPRTIKKYINLIVYVQNSRKLRVETVGLRVLVRREHGPIPDAADR